MKPAIILSLLCLLEACLAAPRSALAQENQAGRAQAAGASRINDVLALRGLVTEFTKAFNAGDAKGLAALFTTNARIVTVDGTAIEGRAAIETQFATSLRENPGQTILIKTESLRFLNADAAVEEGTAAVNSGGPPGDSGRSAGSTRYFVTYVKRDGKWLQDSIRDYPLAEPAPAGSAHDQLQELEWLVGEWVDESDEAVVRTTCRWSENQSFLIRSFRVRIQGKDEMTGTQRIGWDPRLKQIRSWVFDSDGGFSEALWSRDGERWVIKTTGVLKDGRSASATNILTRINRDHAKWASVDRTIGGEVMADTEEITLVRTPPQPHSARSRTRPAQPEETQP